MKIFNCKISSLACLVFIVFFEPAFAQKKDVYKGQVVTNGNDAFNIQNEDKVLKDESDVYAPYDTVRSDVNFENWNSSVRFTRSTLKENILEIVIYESNPSFDLKYVITVKNKMFKINILYRSPDRAIRENEEVDLFLKISPVQSKLILSTLEFKKGTIIRGYTEFQGRCMLGWNDKNNKGERIIKLKGNFKAEIR
jgi:hypothetical protein